MCKNLRVMLIAALAATTLSGCGQVSLSSEETMTEPIFTTTTTLTKRTVRTTKTALVVDGEIDADDEDIGGYYTTTSSVTGSLENEFVRPDDEINEDLRATQRTEVKTFYTIPEHNGTTAEAVTVSAEQTTTTVNGTIKLGEETTTSTKKTTTKKTTTTAFKADALFKLESSMKYSKEISYTVTSDTTYLNLRYGPSKQYEIRLRIPDGSSIKGYGETVGTDGNVWVYTSYNGTNGWVMRELLS